MRLVLTVAALVIATAAWWLGGEIDELVEHSEPLPRVLLVFASLTLFEWVVARFKQV